MRGANADRRSRCNLTNRVLIGRWEETTGATYCCGMMSVLLMNLQFKVRRGSNVQAKDTYSHGSVCEDSV